jgi:hypothetical protein
MDTVVIVGISDNPAITRTIDDARARTKEDVFYTNSEKHFAKFTVSGIVKVDGKKTTERRPLNRAERKECSRMLSKAVDFLWKRTEQEQINQFNPLDHAEADEFVERHKRIIDCVRHIFEENTDRVLSGLKLSPGQCAGMLYLMGSSTSDPDDYRNPKGNDTLSSQRLLSFNNWDKACEFWAKLVDGKGRDWKLVHDMLACPSGMSEEDEERMASAGGDDEDDVMDLVKVREIERLLILSKAWHCFIEGRDMTEDDLRLTYETNEEDGTVVLKSLGDADASFGGIDAGPHRPAEKKPPKDKTEKAQEKKIKDEIRKKSAEELAERLKKMREEKAGPKAKSTTVAEAGSGKDGNPGKPPAPKVKRQTQNEVNAEQTRRALEADQAAAKAGNKKAAAAVAEHKNAKNGGKNGGKVLKGGIG